MQKALHRRNASHVFCNVFDLVPGTMALMAPCCLHGTWCIPPACDVDVTGTPCQDFAPNGNRLGIHGPQWPVFLAWASVILAQHVPLVVHENVPQFMVEALQALMQHQYWVYTFLVDCEDVGFRLISRKRRFTVLYHRAKTQVLHDPAVLYEQVRQVLAMSLACTAWQISDCFLASVEEVAAEITPLALRKAVPLAAALSNMALLLSHGEQERLCLYMQAWASRFGTPACACPWAVFNLADNPGAGYTTWSAASGRIPGLRTHNAKHWVPYLSRWLTNKELLACMGLPVYDSLALAAGVSVMQVRPGPEARHMVGNMMHVASVGTVMAVAMASCRLV